MNANRLSYFLNLMGPSMVVDTACSSSAVAVHLACQSILNGECEMALAGGIKLLLTPKGFIVNSKARMLSPSGNCRPFDSRADGYVRGEGGGLLLLKLLNRALHDGDTVHAVIRSTAVNHDGGQKAGVAVPNPKAQKALLLKTWEKGGLDPTTISYIEAHGTGTSLGDPLEVEGLTLAFAEYTEKRQFCALGSVKPGIGHLEAAAGVAGIIKTVLALKHGHIPPTIGYRTPNPHLRLEESPFYIVDRPVPWENTGESRRAGVSAFGFGGANAHVVLEEAPAPLPVGGFEGPKLFTLSAKDSSALNQKVCDLRDYVTSHELLCETDVSFTLNVGRMHFAHRIAFVASSREELITKLHLVSLDEEERSFDACKIARGVVGTIPFGLAPSTALLLGDPDPDVSLAKLEQLDRLPVWAGALREGQRLLHHLDVEGVTPAKWRRTRQLVSNYALARLWLACSSFPMRIVGTGTGRLLADCLLGSLSLERCLAQAVMLKGQGVPDSADEQIPVELQECRTILCIGSVPPRWGERDVLVCKSYRDVLAALAGLYCAGHEPDFARLYPPGSVRRVPLPTYPFQRRRYWVDEREDKEVVGVSRASPTATTSHAAGLTIGFYQAAWVQARHPDPVNRLPSSGTWLVFCDDAGVGDQVLVNLRHLGQRVVRVSRGDGFKVTGGAQYTINPVHPSDYKQLLDHTASLSGVVYVWGYEPQLIGVEKVERALLEFHSMVFLAQALGSFSRSAQPPVRLVVVTSCGQVVEPQLSVSGGAALLISLANSLPYELRHVDCVVVDLDGGDASPQEVARVLCDELATPDLGSEVVAYRRGQRWMRQLEAIQLRREQTPRIRPNGVYLVTGGVRGVGAEAACSLVRCGARRLVLIGKSPIPPREQWDDWFASHPVSPESDKIGLFRRLEAMGAKVLALQADVTSLDDMTRVVETVENRWERLDGIVHAAGTFDHVHRSLRSKELTTMERVLAPKIRGTSVLDQVTRGRELDFFVLFSSISALSGALAAGQADYAAANAFQDVYAAHLRKRGLAAVSIQWPQWAETGMAAGRPMTKTMSDLGLSLLTKTAGSSAFEEIMQSQAPANLAVLAFERGPASSPVFLRPGQVEDTHANDTKTISTERHDGVVHALTQVMARYCGLAPDEVDPNVPFGEYGMDSLLIADIVGALEGQYDMSIDPSLLLQYPTVQALADFLERKTPVGSKMREARQLACEPGDLSEQELDEGAAGHIQPLDIVLNLRSGSLTVEEAERLLRAGRED
jgi:acyl transferase domain-containing protein/acyl carrier protein